MKKAGADPWQHYVDHGRKEARKWPGDICGPFPFTPLGCYKDAADRALPSLLSGDAGSVTNCALLAQRNNQKYFATQFKGECWGGNDLQKAR